MKKMNRCLLVVFVLITAPSHAMLTRLSRVAAARRVSNTQLACTQQRTYNHIQRPTINVIPAKNQTIPKENVPMSLNLTVGAQRSSGYLSWIVTSLCGLFGWLWYSYSNEQVIQKILNLITANDYYHSIYVINLLSACMSDQDIERFALLLREKKHFIHFIEVYKNYNRRLFPHCLSFFFRVVEADIELIDLLFNDTECLTIFEQTPLVQSYEYRLFLKKHLLTSKNRAKSIAQNSKNQYAILEAMKRTSCDKEIEKQLHISKNSTFEYLYRLVAYVQNCQKHSLGDIEEHFNNMPTFKHMQENVESIAALNDYLKLSDSCVDSMLDKALQKEKELRDAGYHVFYHGQRIAYALPEELATHIYGVENKIDTSNFLLLQVKPSVTGVVGLEEQAQWREKMVHEGNNNLESSNRQNILFLNGSLLHNIHHCGSNSVYYAVRNDNAGNIQISLKDAFASFGHTNIYEKLESMSNELEKDMQALYGDYGQLILVAIPTDKVSHMVYPTSFVGKLQKKTIYGTFFNSHTADSKTIVETLIKNPRSIEDHDFLEFAAPAAWDKGGILNPQSGARMFVFRPTPHASDEQVQAFEQKKKYYFDSVTRELKGESKKSNWVE